MSREKISIKRRVYNILKLKLKSKLIAITKETARLLKVMLFGFILIIAILILKYKPVYEVTFSGETLGYISSKKQFVSNIQEILNNKQEKNIDNIALKEEPQYELKLVIRNKETDEETILAKLEENTITTYKFYEISLNGETNVYVDTLEEAENITDQIKSEYDGDGLELELAITERYTENVNEVKTDTVEVAELSVEEEINQLLEEKEAKEALATINGINLSVLPVSGTITSRFGASSSIRSSTHTGLDIACDKGTPIKAVAKGTVVFAGTHSAYGNLVKIDHGNGIQTWYAHCNKIYVQEGEEVSSGEAIAEVGSTGNSTGNHLHLEIRINGTAVNPQKYLYNNK